MQLEKKAILSEFQHTDHTESSEIGIEIVIGTFIAFLHHHYTSTSLSCILACFIQIKKCCSNI